MRHLQYQTLNAKPENRSEKKKDILKLGMHTHAHQHTYRPRETRTAVKSGEINIFLLSAIVSLTIPAK